MKLVIHEFANLYPMLSEEELQEMADDIAQNGQQNPIIVKDGVLIDGRNRLAACKLAGIEPWIQEHDGDIDESGIKSLILSLNNNRRHLSKGQKAMSVAIAYPDPEKGGRGKSSKMEGFSEVHQGRLSEARKILRFAPHAVADVMSGAVPLSEAYEIACRLESESERMEAERKAKEKREREERKLEEEAKGDEEKRLQLLREREQEAAVSYMRSRQARLAEESPELAEAVNNGVFTLDQAESRLEEQRQQKKALMLDAAATFRDLINFKRNHKTIRHEEFLLEWLRTEATNEDLSLIDDSISLINKLWSNK